MYSGAGAHLLNSNGKNQFMQKYDPEWKRLAPRDCRCRRGIHQEMLTSGASNVFLDIASYMPADNIRSHFPSIYLNCSQYGIDMTRVSQLPICPGGRIIFAAACGQIYGDGQPSIISMQSAK